MENDLKQYRLTSPMSGQRIEFTETVDNIRLQFYREGEASSYFDGMLADMLTYSSGRPWRSDRVRFTDTRITEKDNMMGITIDTETLSVKLGFSFDGNGLLQLEARWENRTDRILPDVAVGIEFGLPVHDKEMITIPHMIYNNNPSADPTRVVPRIGVGPEQGFLCEEHRLPIPCVNLEWKEASAHRYFSFFSIPSYVETPDGIVHYGSMGAYHRDDRTTVAAMSGVLMFNGEKDIVYVSKSKTAPYNGGYLDFAPGFALTKTYVLDWGQQAVPGRAFSRVVHQGLKLFKPEGAKPHSIDEIIRLKTSAMNDRWKEVDGAAGYVKFNDTNAFGKVSKHPLHYMYGWTGQCLKLAWCDAVLGFETGLREKVDRCIKAVDFYLKESGTSVSGLRHCAYQIHEKHWDNFKWLEQPVVSSRAYGETMSDLADIIMLFRAKQAEVPVFWIESLRESAEFFMRGMLPTGIFPAAWGLYGTPADDMITAAGIPCLIAVLKTYQVTEEKRFLETARTAMERYYDLHARTFERPFARSTLDAKCEDKEAGMYFFLAAYELFVLTGEQQYQEWAEISADWLLTFVFQWSPAFDRESKFRKAGFNAAGWPGVSVQNHHLDVFFPTYELWRFGRITGNTVYERLGRMIFDAIGQGICTAPGEWGFTVIGEQAEGFFQTNWQGRGLSNNWNPSWVIAEVLHHALRFRNTGQA